MAPPLSATKAVAVLKSEGLTVVQHGRWKTHNRGARGDGWGEVHGVMLHHTGPYRSPEQIIQLCYDGYTSLPGPLCHGVIAQDGRVHMVGWGRANHAGLGDADVLEAVIAERPLPPDNQLNRDGNARFYGFELVNAGDNEDPYPPAQVEAAVRAAAALLRAHGWGATGDTSVIGHLEWQPGKIDPRGPGWPGMNPVRARVAQRLTHPPAWTPGAAATHTVQPGETLSAIARRHRTSVSRLVALNSKLIKEPDEIEPGWVIRLR